MHAPVALTVAGHDPLGGSGVAADLTTFAAMGVHGVAALTAVTAQHLDRVDDVEAVADELVASQLRGVIDDLLPDAVKTGLLVSTGQVDEVAELVAAGRLPAPIVDPVLVDGAGRRIVSDMVEAAYRRSLFPVAAAITPNRAEVELILDRRLPTLAELIDAAPELAALGPATVIVTGGSSRGDERGAGGDDEATDVVVTADGAVEVLAGPRVATPNTRGSGCTFSAALTAGVARGDSVPTAARAAKAFVTDRITDASGWTFRSRGPVAHRFAGTAQGTSDHSSP